jgi:hypothetical protein
MKKNPSSGSRVVSCRQTDARTYMIKLIVAFRNFAKATKTGGQSVTSQEYRKAVLEAKVRNGWTACVGKRIPSKS